MLSIIAHRVGVCQMVVVQIRYLEPLLPYYARQDCGIIADRVCAPILLRQKYL